jgi:hypothetical protein
MEPKAKQILIRAYIKNILIWKGYMFADLISHHMLEVRDSDYRHRQSVDPKQNLLLWHLIRFHYH